MKMFFVAISLLFSSATFAGEMYTGTVKALYGDNYYAYCAIDDSDMLHCWGKDVEEPPSDLGPVKSVTLGGYPCAIDMKSQIRCWGERNGHPAHIPAEVKYAKSVSSNYWGSMCAINLQGEAYCWRAESDSYDPGNFDLMKLPQQFNNFESIEAAQVPYEACLTDAKGAVACWNQDSTFPIRGPMNPTLKLSYDRDSEIGCSVSTAGKIECFGYTVDASWNSKDGLTGTYDGQATRSTEAIPQIYGKTRDVSVGFNNACAVDEVGKISCWSVCTANACHTDGLSTPTTEKVLRVETGLKNGCAILENRKLTCW